MALPGWGALPISMSQVNTEIGRAWNAALDLNDGTVRTLAAQGGAISMSDLVGREAYIAWSGNSVASATNVLYGPMAIETSGSSFRINGGGWMAMYVNGNFALESKNAYYGLQASGNAIRAWGSEGGYASAWVYFSPGFSGSSDALYAGVGYARPYIKLQTSGGLLRVSDYFDIADHPGAYIYPY